MNTQVRIATHKRKLRTYPPQPIEYIATTLFFINARIFDINFTP